MFAEPSFLGSLTVCFMQCGVISYMFWPCCMMFAIRVVGQKPANQAAIMGATVSQGEVPLIACRTAHTSEHFC